MTGRTHLVFTLAVPYGSWDTGLSAANCKRSELKPDPPTRSALAGLLGAASGLSRDRLGDLARSLCFAMQTLVLPENQLQPDYQNSYTPLVNKNAPRPHTRFEQLRPMLSHAASGMTPVQSWRSYFARGVWLIAVTARDSAADRVLSLVDLAAGLRAPHWRLYAGRASCPLGLPPAPRLVDAPDPLAAFAAYGRPWDAIAEDGTFPPPAPECARHWAADPEYPGLPDSGYTLLTRRDQLALLLPAGDKGLDWSRSFETRSLRSYPPEPLMSSAPSPEGLP